jgi:CheY-like chemotaxis protein
VVDDEEMLRNAIVSDFKRKGYNVLDAVNGHDALAIIEKQKIDVVLTDVKMPNGDGVELLERIKARNKILPVVMFITGFADITLEDAYDKGVEAVFSKPFDRKALAEAVARVTQPLDERWSKQRCIGRIQAQFDIRIKYPELKMECTGVILNIGRGGMFVALDSGLPSINTHGSFEIQLANQTLVGEGVVRWVRTTCSAELKSGCGIEFTFISDDVRPILLGLINSLKTHAFIPKK